jgi:hypothetical protein
LGGLRRFLGVRDGGGRRGTREAEEGVGGEGGVEEEEGEGGGEDGVPGAVEEVQGVLIAVDFVSREVRDEEQEEGEGYGWSETGPGGEAEEMGLAGEVEEEGLSGEEEGKEEGAGEKVAAGETERPSRIDERAERGIKLAEDEGEGENDGEDGTEVVAPGGMAAAGGKEDEAGECH